MFLSNDSLQDPLHASAHSLVIINIAAAHVRLVTSSLCIYHSTRNYHAAKKEVKSTQFARKMIFEEKAIKKQKQTSSLSRNIIPLKIPCLMVYNKENQIKQCKAMKT